MNLTRLAQALTDAGLRSAGHMRRGLFMSGNVFWLHRHSHYNAIEGIQR